LGKFAGSQFNCAKGGSGKFFINSSRAEIKRNGKNREFEEEKAAKNTKEIVK